MKPGPSTNDMVNIRYVDESISKAAFEIMNSKQNLLSNMSDIPELVLVF